MQRFAGWFRDNEGRSHPGALVNVYDAGTNSLSTIYSALGSITAPVGQSNPITTGADGYFAFAAADGVYDIQISLSGQPSLSIPNINFSSVNNTNVVTIGDTQIITGTKKFGSSTNNTYFEADGTLVMAGDATVWDDLRFPATAVNPLGAPSPMGFDTTNVGFTANATATQVIAIVAQLPHPWKVGSTIYPHVHWMPTNTNTGNVLWRLEYKWTNKGDVDAGSFTTLDVLSAGAGTALTHQTASFGGVVGTGKHISSLFTAFISRIGGDVTDTYNADALLKEFDIHYEMDTLGSRTELVK